MFLTLVPGVGAPVHGVDLSQVTTQGASRPHLNPPHGIQPCGDLTTPTPTH
jgi:hypothetical protein